MPSMGEHVLPTWHSLSAREIAAFVERDPVVVLPLASIEQHGPHLPLSTDLEIGLGILRYAFRKLPTDFPACALPSQWVGASTEHLSFPGTLSIDPDLLTTMVVELGRGLSDSGVRRLVLSNSHGGNRGALDAAGLRLRREEGLLVVKASHGLFPPPETVDLPESEWRGRDSRRGDRDLHDAVPATGAGPQGGVPERRFARGGTRKGFTTTRP